MRMMRAITSAFGGLARLVLGLLAVATIIWWLSALQNLAEGAPQFSALEKLTLTVPDSSEVVFGRAELLQPAGARSAELSHVRLRATEDGRLLISRVAELRRLNVEFGGKTEEGSSERYEIVQNRGTVTRVSAGAQYLEITPLADGALRFDVENDIGETTTIVDRNGQQFSADGEPAPACFDTGLTGRLVSTANGISDKVTETMSALASDYGLPGWLQRRGKTTLAVLGGTTDCALSTYALVAMPRANPGIEFVIRRNLSDDRLFISTYRGEQLAPVSYATWDGSTLVRRQFGLTGIEIPLASTTPIDAPTVTHFTAGKTRYSIDAFEKDGAWEVSVIPSRRVALFVDSLCSRRLAGGTDEAPSAEDCPPPLSSSPNVLPEGAEISVERLQLPGALDRLFVTSSQGLSNPEILARALAIAVSVLIVLAVPGVTIWRTNGSIIRAAFLVLAAMLVLVLVLLPDLLSVAGTFADIPNQAEAMFLGMGALWVCATIVIMLDRPGGVNLIALWLVLTAVIALGSTSMFSLSAEGPNTDWERFFVKHKLAVLDILPLLAIAVTVVSPTALKLRIGNDFAGRPSLFSPTIWLLAIVFVLFVAWFFVGTQTGLAGSIQPVEAGKFAIVVLLGAVLAQWLIRARLLAQSWFGITIIAVGLSVAFIFALLFVPAVKSDYSPLIIITSVAATTGVLGLMAVGLRIREEERDDLTEINRIPLPYSPTIRDTRLGVGQIILLIVFLAAIVASPRIDREQIAAQFAALEFSAVVIVSAALLSMAVFAMVIKVVRVPRALVIIAFCMPLALLGAWALYRDETVVLAIAVLGLLTIVFSVALPNRVNWTLARMAIIAPVIAIAVAFMLRDLPLKAGLGVAEWSWFAGSDRQISELEKVLGEGRRLPVERLMSWADLRYGRTASADDPRELELRDMNFHVLRSRATIASAPCGMSHELTEAPFYIGDAVRHLGSAVSTALGISCDDEPTAQAAGLPCTPSTLKSPVRPHCVPVVQSDFAATFITSRLGIGAAALLVVLQAVFLFLVFRLFLILQSKRSRDPVETGADQALAAIALGVGMLFAMQWILAWSNAFGIFPVMGQPMTWLSAGTSHHLFMAIPACLALLTATRLAGMKAPVLTIRIPPKRRG